MASKRPLSSTEPQQDLDAKRTHLVAPPQTSTGSTSYSMAPTHHGPASVMPPVPITLDDAISLLSPEQVKASLVQYAQLSQPFYGFLMDNHAAEMNRRHQINLIPKTFDRQSQIVWNQIGMALRGSGSHQYDAAFDVSDLIDSTINSMLEIATAPPSLLETRQNMMFTLIDIGDMIATCDDTLGDKLRDMFQMEENSLTKAFLDLACSFNDAKRPYILQTVIQTEPTSATFEEKPVELINLCDEYCIMPDLADGLDVLRGEVAEKVDSGTGTESEGQH
ncbi:hypothetical protein HDK90DRAFT_312150 [Phyllosticta capitalensis]|uniref:Uncharacterized protein n=1 Tax=Phyllosticta capitalensis TaxID=121624 RepID=A0ABR1YL96_9PEZI